MATIVAGNGNNVLGNISRRSTRL